jgi:RNA polymerase sigma-70 factor (ECF subfamily)
MALLEPIHERALATARRLSRSATDGDDLYQEAVLQAFEKLHTLRSEPRFRSWFYATLLNRHRTRQRRAFWRRRVPWEEAFAPGSGPVDPHGGGWAARDAGAGRLARALGSLAAEQREAIVLFELDGYSIEEVAEMQGASVPAVKSRLVRGRQRLRRWYERNGWLRGDADTVSGEAEQGPSLCRSVAAASSRSGSGTGPGTGGIP